MVTVIELQYFKAVVGQQLQDANVKWEDERDTQGKVQHADDLWTISDASMTVRLQTIEQNISQLEASDGNQKSEIDNLKMTSDSMGDTITGINEQLRLIHGAFGNTEIERELHTQRDRWGAADLKYRGDTIEINERLKNAASSQGGDHSGVGKSTFIHPKHITIEAYSGAGAAKADCDTWRGGIADFVNRVFPQVKPILIKIRKSDEGIDEEVFDKVTESSTSTRISCPGIPNTWTLNSKST